MDILKNVWQECEIKKNVKKENFGINLENYLFGCKLHELTISRG